jgi:metal-dependent amidase/aminoacylase/carboxypeptidase family protein
MIETATLDYRVREGKDDAVGWRRHLHRNPGISFHEEETSQFVQETLLSFGGLELSRPTPTSVVARLVETVRDRRSPCGRAWTRCL